MPGAADIDPERVFDIIIVGGGITGAGTARDAALRGLSCLVLEKGDFSSGVTSKSTRLIHGGLRYLANFELGLVAESLRERAILRRQAPYLIHPMPILIPIYRGDPHGRTVMSAGIHLYDFLSHEKDIPHYFTAGRQKTLQVEPRLRREGLTGSALFYDHQILMPERLVIENLIAAREAGAELLSYSKVEKIDETQSGCIVHARDVHSATLHMFRSKVVINAAGPWIDSVRQAGRIEQHAVIHPTKGVHLVLPRLSGQALFVTSRDERMFFIIPFGDCSLIGTTDTNYAGNLDEVHADRDDIDYLLNESRRALPDLHISREAILYTYAGIRPLAFSGERTSKISRKHRVVKEGRSGRIITIAGGKLTTYRNMANDVLDAACTVLGVRTSCTTDQTPLPGSLPTGYSDYMREAVPELSSRYAVDPATAAHLISLYGGRAYRILERIRADRPLGEQILPGSRDVYAQIPYSISEEGAKTLSDIMLRRMHIGMSESRGMHRAGEIAEIAGRELKWNDEDKERNIAEYETALRKDRACLAKIP